MYSRNQLWVKVTVHLTFEDWLFLLFIECFKIQHGNASLTLSWCHCFRKWEPVAEVAPWTCEHWKGGFPCQQQNTLVSFEPTRKRMPFILAMTQGKRRLLHLLVVLGWDLGSELVFLKVILKLQLNHFFCCSTCHLQNQLWTAETPEVQHGAQELTSTLLQCAELIATDEEPKPWLNKSELLWRNEMISSFVCSVLAERAPGGGGFKM